MDFLRGYLLINVTATRCCSKHFYPVLFCMKNYQSGALEGICPVSRHIKISTFFWEKSYLSNPTDPFVLQEGHLYLQERITGVILMCW